MKFGKITFLGLFIFLVYGSFLNRCLPICFGAANEKKEDILTLQSSPVIENNKTVLDFKNTSKQRSKKVSITKPGTLTQSDTVFILQNDIVAAGTAFTINGSQITLDLNGHMIIYNNEGINKEAFGIVIPGYHKKDIAIVNGIIKQGEGVCNGNAYGIGCNPIYNYDSPQFEVGGIHISYWSPGTSGILLHWVDWATIHHTIIEDQGNRVIDRHMGVAAIEADRGGDRANHFIHHNLIKRARQIGIRAGKTSEVYNNEVFIDSVVTNSIGINVKSGLIHDNKITGQGVHPIGIWPGNNIKIFLNFVEIQNTRKGEEYGDTGAACFRMTWGNDNVEVMNNTFILKAEENYQGTGVNSWGRAIWVGLPNADQKALFHDNLIMATNSDGKAKAAAIAIVCNNESSGLQFKNNKIISNWANVLLSDHYGHAGGYAKFIENTFIRQDQHPNYKVVKSQYSSWPSTAYFINNQFKKGASLENIDLEFWGTAIKEIAVAWHLNIRVVNRKAEEVKGAKVLIVDNKENTVFEGLTDEQGRVKAEVVGYLLTNQLPVELILKSGSLNKKKGYKDYKTPHKITVQAEGKIVKKIIAIDGNKSIEIPL